jgi:predicted RNA-binding protein YlxR (DUF448 family)
MSKPIRMCVVCRDRILQENLIRLQCKDGVISRYTNSGRSFYLCINCKDNKNLSKKIAYICKNSNKNENISILKEILVNAESKN